MWLRWHKLAVRILLTRNPDVNDSAETPGQTALYEAARLGHDDVVTLLLDNGADAKIRHLKAKFTPAIVAQENGHKSTEAILDLREGQFSLLLSSIRYARLKVKMAEEKAAKQKAAGGNGETRKYY
jgi:ankyrin repeat protein